MKNAKSSFCGWGIGIFLLLLGIGMLVTTIHSMISYRDIQANPVTVTATVFKYEEDTKTDADGMDKVVYDLYMSYTYEGEEYTTRYDTVRKESDAKAALGKSVQIQINPDKPSSSSNEHAGYLFGFLPSILFLGAGVLFVYYQVKKH